jgi:hypothetical protein
MSEEIRVTSPFENNDFFNMIISENGTNGKKFQQQISYDLNIDGYDRNDSLLKLILNNISIFRKNLINNYKELINSKYSKIIDTVINKWNLDELSYERACDIYIKNREYFYKYFNYYHNGWLYLNSEKTNPANNEVIDSHNVCQRLYISINSDCIDDFSRELQIIFENNDLPYNFKIQIVQKLKSADCICIYSDSFERTKEYLNVIKDLVDKYKDAIHKPQPHLGIINDQIGLGFQLKDGYSYSEIMEEISYKAIEKACENIYLYNKNSRIIDNNIESEYKNGSLINYIKKKARTNLSMYQILKDEFEENFRQIVNQEYPNFDIDMWDITRELESKKQNNK